MNELKTTIHPLNEGAAKVDVTFEYGGVTHNREVNAVFTDGKYDEEATAERVAEVGRGVVHKIDVGAVTNAPEPEVPTEDEADLGNPDTKGVI